MTCLVMGSCCHGDHSSKWGEQSATRGYDYSNSSIYVCKSLLACFHIMTPIGFAPTLLGSLLSCLDYFWPAQEVQLSMRSQQESVALLSQHIQPQPGARADELGCCVLYIYTCLNSLKPEKPQAPTAVDNTQRFAHRMK